MLDVPPIMVQMRDRKWTLAALHLACAVARNSETSVVLIRMVQVQHIQWLAMDLEVEPPSYQEVQDLDEFCATAEDYGVQLIIQTFRYATLLGAISDAADYVNARIVFATLPNYHFKPWRKLLMWDLSRRLRHHQRQLCTLEDGSDISPFAPSILVPPARKKRIPKQQQPT
jgi:hypothetical protein